MSIESGTVTTRVYDGIGVVSFSHPKGNSLPGALLRSLAEQISEMGTRHDAKVVVLRSEGDAAFCGGAAFDELLSVDSLERAQAFFSGFANLILAMRRCPKFIIARVHAKAVGGGVGVVAASDYAIALESASIRLSELALGIGPFTIGPAVLRKIGTAAFTEASISADWRDAAWAKTKGLYADVVSSISELDTMIDSLSRKLAGYSPEAMRALKAALYEGTEEWEELLNERVRTTSSLVLTRFAQDAIGAAKARKP